MPTEIPPPPVTTSFTKKSYQTRDLNLAAACLSDSRIPRFNPVRDASAYVEDGQRFYNFKFAWNDDVKRVFRVWQQCVQGAFAQPVTDPVPAMYRAAHYSDVFSRFIRQEKSAVRAAVLPEGCEWITNTKVAATALALAKPSLIPESILRTLVFRHGQQYGFVLRQGPYIAAFEDPEAYVASHPDEPLAYCVSFFYLRERLRDIVNGLPARHILREGNDVAFVVEPEPRTT